MAGLINSAMGANPANPINAATGAGRLALGGVPDMGKTDEAAEDPNEEAVESSDLEVQEDAGEPGGKDAADAVKMVTLMAMKALYIDGAIQDALGVVQSAASPAKGLADATWDLLQHMDDKSGGKIPLQALAPAASEILGAIADSAAKKGLPVRGKEIAIATQSLVLRLMDMAGMDTAQMQAQVQKVDYDQVGTMIDQQLAQGKGQ